MFKKLFLILSLQFIVFVCLAAQGKRVCSISEEETVVLEHFFRALIEETEGGYVLYGQKPVCAHAFSKELFTINSPWHAHFVALREGARIWKKLSSEVKNAHFSVFINEKEEARLPGWIHLFVINRPLFLKTVKENLSLFQYVLGPKTTPEKLLEKMASSFDSTLHEDKVLIGLILGYGRENALYVSRMEYISAYLNAAGDIPFKCTKKSPEDQLRGFLLPPPENLYAFKIVTPSCGFQTLEEELNELESQIKVSSEKLETSIPNFIFGHIDDRAANQLVAKLEKAQNEIKSLLNSKNFLQKTLKSFLNEEFTVPQVSNYQFPIDQEGINKIIAKAIWEEELQDYDRDCIPLFINALLDFSVQDDNFSLLHLPTLFKDIAQVRENLAKTAVFFSTLEQQQDIHCIVPQKLYYKILEPGDDNIICASTKVCLNYAFLDSLGRPIKRQPNVLIDLNSTISGFAHAVKGMKLGETREIYIHPSLAYGIYTPYERGVLLKAVVTLLNIEKSDEPFSEMTSLDVSFIEDEEFLKSVRERYENTLIWRANLIGSHLKKSKDVDLDLIKQHLQELSEGKETFSKLTPAEATLINRVHWNIYFGS